MPIRLRAGAKSIKHLGIHMEDVRQLMHNYKGKMSIEYLDNRLSLYCAQYGKCAVTGMVLDAEEVHCHHKIPVHMGGKDNYQNLIILHEDVHRLVHAKLPGTIQRYAKQLTLNSRALQKVNKLRKLIGIEEIITL